jgi:hypothetical protein
MASPEALNRAITEDYAAFLGQAPDPTGEAALLNLLRTGGPRKEEAAAQALLASDEFFQRAAAS